MHIFMITLFLIIACNHSTPHPLKNNETRNLVLSELHNLANTCNNSFLVDTIKNKSDLCKINETSNMSDLCFMFYDINMQLCDVFNYSEFDLQNNYKTQIEKTQNVELLCDHAKIWKLATIEENSVFKFMEQVLKNSKYCYKLCEVSDLLSDDSNFFCKYFNWGNELIQSLRQKSQATNSVASASDKLGKPAESSGVASSSSTTANATEVKNESAVNSLNADNPGKVIESPVDHVIIPKKPEEKPQTLILNQVADLNAHKIETDNSSKITGQSATSDGISSLKNEGEKNLVGSSTVARKDNVDKSGQQPQDSVIEAPQKNIVLESGISDDDDLDTDYNQDREESEGKKNEGILSDPQMDKEKKSPKFEIESIDENSAQRGNIYGSDSFPTDDDHFFPFFLTAIIIVVLLYILYHNKNKFTKLILGLIVEGRQSGRRRNSRGHAYRRLDTLEQAMSSSSAAPPSKIIY